MRSGMKMLAATSARSRGGNSGGRMESEAEARMGYGGSGGSNYGNARMGYGGSGGSNYGNARMGYGGSGGSNYGNAQMGYAGMESGEMAYGGMEQADSRFRDRRGRQHYNNGRFAPMRGAMDDWEEMDDNYGAESRRYRRYSNGRFAPRSAYEGGSGGGEMHYPSPFVPPVYERDGERGVNPIGFVPQGYWDMESNYGMYADHKPMDEMEHRSSHMQRGGASGGSGKMDKAMAEEWVRSMKNEDGSRGPHWNIDQAQQAMKTRGVQAEPWEFWAVMNMMYSDYCKVFKTHNLNTMDVYADMAAAWINDKDAGPEKTAKYFQHIVSQN